MPERPAIAPRVSRLRALLRRSGLEAFLILDLKNIRYLTGFTGSDGALVVGAGKPALLVDGRYTTQARKQAPGTRVVLYRDKVSGIAEALSAGGVEHSRLRACRRDGGAAELPAPEVEKGALEAPSEGARRHPCRQGPR